MNTISENSKIWIYQSNQSFDLKTEAQINDKLKSFVSNWNAHHQKLNAHYKILHHLFIIMIVDESSVSASGCSIDSSVKIIKEIEEQFNIHFFNRSLISYFTNDAIEICDTTTFQQKIDSGLISSETIVFNNLITTYKELNTNWMIPIKNSWHQKIFTFNVVKN